MSPNRYEYFECDNPECRLRFPGANGSPRFLRCPLCRSSIHIVAEVDNFSEKDGNNIFQNGHKIGLVLDNIRSAWNVGSLFRTADGTGINDLYLCGITPSPDTAKLRKTALGAETGIKWTKFSNGVTCVRQLKTEGFSLWALEDLPNSTPLFDLEAGSITMPIVLVVGNELSGVDPGIIAECDKVISIPMQGMKKSYNVAVAFGIAASFLLYLQRVSQESRRILPRT